jgi:hypothetical protein
MKVRPISTVNILIGPTSGVTSIAPSPGKLSRCLRRRLPGNRLTMRMWPVKKDSRRRSRTGRTTTVGVIGRTGTRANHPRITLLRRLRQRHRVRGHRRVIGLRTGNERGTKVGIRRGRRREMGVGTIVGNGANFFVATASSQQWADSCHEEGHTLSQQWAGCAGSAVSDPSNAMADPFLESLSDLLQQWTGHYIM